MNPLKKLLGIKRWKANDSGRHAPSFGMVNMNSMFNAYHSDAYASAFPSIRAISNEYMAVRPFAIDANGKQVSHPVIDALYHPNQSDSSVSFAEKIAVSTLSLHKTYILVWRKEGKEARPGGDFTKANVEVAGFTFLEYPGVTRRDGRTFYNIGSQEFSDTEVIVLPGGVNPHNLYAGYSPSEAARRWAKLDDYIADYQAGFFENGAVPAGQFLITASSTQEYEDIVDMLQERHRGAGKNGNVTFSHRPVDRNTGKPVDAQIEWVPFSQSNKDIDFKNLFEQTNHRIDVTYGVPAIVKGIDDAATYANAQVAEKTFAKRAVYPLLLRNYTQITHELNRITNGLGVAITFDYEIPTVADEEYVESQTKEVEGRIIRDMIEAGYTLESIIDSFKMSNAYKNLKTGTTSETKIDNDKPDVDEGGEVKKSPDPEKIDGVTPVNKRGSKRTNPKAELSDLQKLEAAARQFMQAQVDKAIDDLDSESDNKTDRFFNEVVGSPTPEQEDKFVADMLEHIVAIMVARGEIQYAAGITMLSHAGLSTANLIEFSLSDTAKDSYQSYLRRVGQSYSKDTQQSIRNVLARADVEELNRKELQDALRNIMNTDEWRVTRLGKSELNRSQSYGGLESMKQIQAESGAVLEKSLSHEGSSTPPCEFCQALEGEWVKVDEPLLSLDDKLTGTDGGILVNNFVSIEAGDIHPNGFGSTVYRVAQ